MGGIPPPPPPPRADFDRGRPCRAASAFFCACAEACRLSEYKRKKQLSTQVSVGRKQEWEGGLDRRQMVFGGAWKNKCEKTLHSLAACKHAPRVKWGWLVLSKLQLPS